MNMMGTQDCLTFAKYTVSSSSVMVVSDGQKDVAAESYEVTIKLALDCLDINVITNLSTNFLVISVRFVEFLGETERDVL